MMLSVDNTQHSALSTQIQQAYESPVIEPTGDANSIPARTTGLQFELLRINNLATFFRAFRCLNSQETVTLARILTFACVFSRFAITLTFAAIDASTMYCITSTGSSRSCGSSSRQSHCGGGSSDQSTSFDSRFHLSLQKVVQRFMDTTCSH